MTESNLSPLRALMCFTALPEHHQTFRVVNDNCGVHLRPGEYAVVDLSDREPQHGELFLIEYPSGRERRVILQAHRRMMQVTPPPAPKKEAWTLCHLAGFRPKAAQYNLDGSCGAGVREYHGLADGPYRPEHLAERVVGRVVGYADDPMGRCIPQLEPDY